LANTQSAIKRIRSSARRREHNLITRGRARTAVKKARLAVAKDVTQAPEAVKQAIRELDKAAGKGIIHKNNAARRKSRLLKLLAKQTQTT
jgi:small subunit ribosomal protein S20